MADPTLPLGDTQTDIEMPNGIVLSGNGGDVAAIQTAVEARHEEHVAEQTDAPAPVPGQPATRGRRRFEELTFAREEEKRRADAAEAKAKALESRLRDQQAPPPPQAQVQPQQSVQPPPPQYQAPQAEPLPQPTRPKPLEIEVGGKYAQYADYVEDLADWKAEQRLIAERGRIINDLDARTTQRIEAERASRSRKEFVENTVFRNGQAVYPDFDATLKASTKIVPYIVQEAVLKLPNPEHAIYALAKDDSQVDRLIPFLNDPMRLGIEVAQLMPRKASPPPASTPTVVRTTHASSPIQPVGAGARTTTPDGDELAKVGDYEGYKALRTQQLKSSRR